MQYVFVILVQIVIVTMSTIASTTHNKAYVHVYYLCETELSNNTCKHNLMLKCVYACPCMCVCVYVSH